MTEKQALIMKTALAVVAPLQAAPTPAVTADVKGSALVFAVSFDSSKSAAPLDGRLLLLLSTDPAEEPRFQINESPKTQIVFGTDIADWRPGQARLVDGSMAGVFGYPIRSLSELKPGDYTVQAVLDRYETFKRADGHVLKLPNDRGEGRRWNRAPGNLFSKPQVLRLDPASSGRITLELSEEITPIPPPADTKYVKHIRLQSERLTKFWGRPI